MPSAMREIVCMQMSRQEKVKCESVSVSKRNQMLVPPAQLPRPPRATISQHQSKRVRQAPTYASCMSNSPGYLRSRRLATGRGGDALQNMRAHQHAHAHGRTRPHQPCEQHFALQHLDLLLRGQLQQLRAMKAC